MRKPALLLAFLLVGCHPENWGAPEIGRDLSTRPVTGTNQFDQRVKRVFPVGSSEASMTQELERQGFSRSPTFDGIESADFSRAEVLSSTSWSVRWRARAGRIVEVWGVYGFTGL